MKEIANEMTRAELAEEFRGMAHGFFHMNELPHEEADRVINTILGEDPNAQEWANTYINHVSGVLLLLSNEVKRVGQEAIQRNLAPRQSDKSARLPPNTACR